MTPKGVTELVWLLRTDSGSAVSTGRLAAPRERGGRRTLTGWRAITCPVTLGFSSAQRETSYCVRCGLTEGDASPGPPPDRAGNIARSAFRPFFGVLFRW